MTNIITQEELNKRINKEFYEIFLFLTNKTSKSSYDIAYSINYVLVSLGEDSKCKEKLKKFVEVYKVYELPNNQIVQNRFNEILSFLETTLQKASCDVIRDNIHGKFR